MPNIYETGTITNSHEIIHKMIGLLANIGWQKHATLKTDANDSDGYDVVFHSTGEDGDKDVYIRLCAGLGDALTTTGDIQFPIQDGYNGFVNGLAYQYFPSSGITGSDGSNELGVYGPILYMATQTNGDLSYYNMFNFASRNLSRGETFFLGTNISSSFVANQGKGIGFDGRLNLYECNGSSTFARISLFSRTHTSLATGSVGTGQTIATPFVRKNNGQETMYIAVPSGTVGSRTAQYVVSTNAWTQGHIGDPPFDFSSSNWSGAQVVGTKRRNFAPNGSPEHRLLYWFRGHNGTSGFTQWSYLDTETNTFSASLITPALPTTMGGSFSAIPSPVFAPREATGYANDRLYTTSGNGTGFFSIAIGDDGYVAADAWTTHSSLPFSATTGHRIAFIGKSIFLVPGSTATDPEYHLYRWALPSTPTASGSWTLISDEFFPTEQDTNGFLFEVHNHLCNRIRITEGATNTYWAFADKDRIVLVIKNASGNYNYIYTGLYQSYLDTTSATLVNAGSIGDSDIEVSDSSIFAVGRKYLIVDSTGTSSIVTGVDMSTRNMAPSQLITVLGISGNHLIITALENDYAAGSKVAEDPLPLMVRVHSQELAQTLNNISLDRDNDYTDPPFQVYRLRPLVDSTITQAGDTNERSDENLLFPIILYNVGLSGIVGNEARGQMKNVYAIGTALASEAEVDVGSDQYIVFDIEESGESRRIVVGPK
jgi:hypothetical protein